jgi:NCS1 family nucleobase:cation symporter-1
MAFGLILWLHSADTAARFQNVLLFVSYWIPAFVAIVSVDWWLRRRGRETIDPALETTARADAVAALATFVVAYAVAVPFMDTSIFVGAFAEKWHGADIAYFVNFFVALALYGGYRTLRSRSRAV